ncbi:MAG: DUF5106 domain-containing protein [Flavobacteriales bacterium]|nr:DUF5106 domain-containing protein [Flavobacteriales bacterium]
MAAQSPNAKSPYTIKGHITGLKDTAVYLANYYGNKLYYNDTARVDAKGNFSFEGKPYNECGKYAFVLPGPKYFDFIVAEENIFIEADSSNSIDKIKFKESKNNQLFYEYIHYINEKRKEREPIDKSLGDSLLVEDQKKPFRDRLESLNKEVVAYQKNLIATYPDLLVSKLLKMSMDVEVPPSPEGLTEDEKAKWQYYWFRQHYWDNVDLTDPRLVRDQSFHKVLERYLTQTLPQIPDTMCVETKKLVERTGNNYDAFKYIVHHATYLAETSKIMCMDRWFVYMVDNWYKTGKVDWIKEDKLKNILESADEKRFCLCGEIAPDIILPDTTETNWVSMYGLNTKYTLLVIWEATCGHCKKEVPKLHDLYLRWKDKGLGVYAVEGELENEKWLKFIHEKELLDWQNVSDTPEIMEQDSATKLIWKGITTLQSLNFRKTYDVSSTPKVFLMDKDHKIIAKQLSAEQLEELLQKLESGQNVDTSKMKQTEYEDEDEVPEKKPVPNPKKQPPHKQ